MAAGLMNTTLPECKFRGNEQCAPKFLHVLPNKTYRIRIASTTALAALNLAIGNHKMVVVEADGYYVKPFTVDDLDIYSGESYSVLLTTDQDPTKNYWISVGVRARTPETPQALAILLSLIYEDAKAGDAEDALTPTSASGRRTHLRLLHRLRSIQH